MINEDNYLKINNIFNKYDLNKDDKDYLKSIIYPIFNHNEFQKRMSNKFYHHGTITLGEHIIEDSILTYLLSKKYALKKKDNDYRMDLAIKIAMLHDLYTIPWQNNKKAKVHHFFNKHGFRHPIEACINAITWYPDIFQNTSDSEIIIDGILHHMFPLPVRALNRNIEKVELKNIANYGKINDNYKQIIINSLKRKQIGVISLCRSKYMEGKIMAKADRIISRHQIKNIKSAKALLTGHNKDLN